MAKLPPKTEPEPKIIGLTENGLIETHERSPLDVQEEEEYSGIKVLVLETIFRDLGNKNIFPDVDISGFSIARYVRLRDTFSDTIFHFYRVAVRNSKHPRSLKNYVYIVISSTGGKSPVVKGYSVVSDMMTPPQGWLDDIKNWVWWREST